jgi:peptidoglycan/xylan/chitin deacetylase (PgdA/CDA1 family)
MEYIKKIFDTVLGSEVVYNFFRKKYLDPLFPFIHAVTYHDTAFEFQDKFREQLEWYKLNYVNCDINDLILFLDRGIWNYDRPGLIISFDDGLKSNFDYAIPLLEEYGFTGWFMVSPGFINLDSSEQKRFAKANLIEFSDVEINSRIAMSWKELIELEKRGHVITCHTMYHKRLSTKLTTTELKVEVEESKDLLQSKLRHSVNMFTWVGGEEWAYSREAFEMLLSVGYKIIFSTNCAPIKSKQSSYFIERYHIDPFYKLNRLRFVLGGFYDVLYFWKRRRVYKKLVQ